jgi:hypothetical protein
MTPLASAAADPLSLVEVDRSIAAYRGAAPTRQNKAQQDVTSGGEALTPPRAIADVASVLDQRTAPTATFF